MQPWKNVWSTLNKIRQFFIKTEPQFSKTIRDTEIVLRRKLYSSLIYKSDANCAKYDLKIRKVVIHFITGIIQIFQE